MFDLKPIGTLALVAIFLFSVLIIGCKTLTVEVREKAHCHLKTSAPHSVKCTVDGRIVYEQSGPMELDLKGCGGE